MKTTKWKVSWVIALSIVILLSACNSKNGSQPQQETAGSAAPASAAGSGTGEKVTLNGVFLGSTWGTSVQELAKEYEKETGVKVNIELVGRDVIYQKLAISLAGKANYDIFSVDYNWVPEFASQKNLLQLDDMIKKYNFDTSKILPKALASAQWNGKNGDFGGGGPIFGLPQTVHPHLLWYRSDLFNDEKNKADFKAKYGYDLAPPKDMKQFRDAAEFFNGMEVDGQKIYGWAAQASKGFGNVHTWLTFLYSNGGDVFDWNTMKSSLSTPQSIEATKVWADLLQFSPPGINDYTFVEVASDAAQGKLAMAIHWSWSAFEVDDPTKSKTVGKWDFAPTPAMAAGSVPDYSAWPMVIPVTTKHPDEAFKFIAWLESKDNDVKQALLGAGDPVREESYSDPRLTEKLIDGTNVKAFRRYDALQEAMKTTKARPFFPKEEKWESIVSEYLSAIQLGQMSVEEALKKADEEVGKMIK